eukprot:8612234-Ditylum_brightwellii.AAC.1
MEIQCQMYSIDPLEDQVVDPLIVDAFDVTVVVVVIVVAPTFGIVKYEKFNGGGNTGGCFNC